MGEMIAVENGSMGRVAYARIAPNEDLVQGVEKLCLAEGFTNAFVRGALGSLVDACMGTIDGKYLQIQGPAVEIVSLAGEVRQDAAPLFPLPDEDTGRPLHFPESLPQVHASRYASGGQHRGVAVDPDS